MPLVARYADACNVFDIPDGGATVRHKLGVLERCCAEVGRPYEAIRKVIATRVLPDESPAAFAERCAGFVELGVDDVGIVTTGPWTEETVGVLVEAAPLLAGVGRP